MSAQSGPAGLARLAGGCALKAVACILATAMATQPAMAEQPTVDVPIAILRGLDKITARVQPIIVEVGQLAEFGSLTLQVQACRTTRPDQAPENAVFLQIEDEPPGEDRREIFSGWMFSSSPSVSALDHAVFDVWLERCATEIPQPPEDMGGEESYPPLPESQIIPPQLPERRRSL